MISPIAFVLDKGTVFFQKKARKALEKSTQASDCGDHKTAAYWYRKHLRYTRMWKKVHTLI